LTALLFCGLFAALFVCFFLVFVPVGGEVTTPFAVTVDRVKRRLEARLAGGERRMMLDVLGRSGGEVVRAALLIGLASGLLPLVFWRWIGPFALPLALGAGFAGVVSTGWFLQNEFQRWQAKLLSGVPILLDFTPAFLETGIITRSEALSLTLPFVPEPLRTELWKVLDQIKRTGRVEDAMDALAARARHPLVDAVCYRLAATWNTTAAADMFADLADQEQDLMEEVAAKGTAARAGLLALICVAGLVGIACVLGYPALAWIREMISGGLGG